MLPAQKSCCSVAKSCLNPVQYYEPPSVVLQALCLSDLIP